MPHHPRLSNYSANKYVEDVGGQAAANVLCECADDGSQDENARSVPTHHEKVYMSKKKVYMSKKLTRPPTGTCLNNSRRFC